MSESFGSPIRPLGLLSLEDLGSRSFSGSCVEGAIGRVFGGHVLAQALRAASFAIDDRRPIHSLHASFIRPASPAQPLVYTTEVLKSGRSLDVIEFRAKQSSRVMLAGFASAHEPEPSIQVGLPMPDVVGPDELRAIDSSPSGTNSAVRAPFELRYLATKPGVDSVELWLKTRAEVPSDAAIVHTALLAYAVDFLVTRSAHVAVPSIPLVGASLDHAMWFHRPFRIDEWLFISSSMIAYSDSRSLCTCQVFDRAGNLVATATQEALIRSADPSA